MNGEPSNAEVLNRAGLAGLALGAVSTAYMFATQYLPQIVTSNAAVSLISIPLWIAKFVGCIWILKAFMSGLASSFSGTERRHTLRLGMLAAVFSALIFSAAMLANMLFISPDAINGAFDQYLGMYASKLDSNAIAAIEAMKEKLPTISFFSNLFYCIIYGTVVSSVLSHSIPRTDPFANFHDGPQDIEEQ